jgi:hypothetical protein
MEEGEAILSARAIETHTIAQMNPNYVQNKS